MFPYIHAQEWNEPRDAQRVLIGTGHILDLLGRRTESEPSPPGTLDRRGLGTKGFFKRIKGAEFQVNGIGQGTRRSTSSSGLRWS